MMKYNENPISLREGKLFIDGIKCGDAIKVEFQFTPDTWNGRQLSDITPSTRWMGGTITGTITRRRTNRWIKDAIKKYTGSKATPEFTIQGIMDDENSDFYAEFGVDTTTLTGCVLTGNLPLTALDSNGQVVEDPVSFNARFMT